MTTSESLRQLGHGELELVIRSRPRKSEYLENSAAAGINQTVADAGGCEMSPVADRGNSPPGAAPEIRRPILTSSVHLRARMHLIWKFPSLEYAALSKCRKVSSKIPFFWLSNREMPPPR